MMTSEITVRIFISSPGDVQHEREKSRQVIDNLQRNYKKIKLQPVLWEDLALPATASFQESIDYVVSQQRIDIAVFILWSRMGSPLGPGIFRTDGSPYRSGTEREFDVMLSAFEQSGRRYPVILAYSRSDEEGFRQSLTSCPSDILEDVIQQRKLAEKFIREQFHDSEGYNVRAYSTYREPVSFARRLHTHLQQILDELLGESTVSRWVHEPYRGLEFFDIEHAPIFYGRDEQTYEILQRLRDQEQAGLAFVVIVGASGSGKSSIARAGVAASLKQNAYDDDVKEWRVATLFPGLGGVDLNRALIHALAEQVPEFCRTATALDDVSSGFAKDAALTVKLVIRPAFERASELAKGVVRVLLLVDQLEELWTDRRITDEDREKFFEVLEAIAHSGHVSVLATLRSDFYPNAQRISTFLRLKGERGHFDLLPPGPAAIHRLITEPARLAGLRFETQPQTGLTLDQLILQDALKDTALPLLQYALSELYQQRDEPNRLLSFASYDKLGGVEGALGKSASDTFRKLPPEVQTTLPEILPHLVAIDVDGEQSAVRRRAPLSLLTDTKTRKALTEELISARFLTTDRQGDLSIVSLAHEALLSRWNDLSQWVTKNREHLRLRTRTEQSQKRWSSQSEDSSLLLASGLQLEEGQTLLRDARQLLSRETIRYIESSIKHRKSEYYRHRRIRNFAMAMSLAAALIATVAAIWIDSERSTAVTAKNNEIAAKEKERRQKELAEESEKKAIDARDAESEQRLLAERQQMELAKRVHQLELADYDATISQTREAIFDGALERARQYLRQCRRWDMCSWEYDFLNGLVDGQSGVRRLPFVIDYVANCNRVIAVSPRGDLIAVTVDKPNYGGQSGEKVQCIRLLSLNDLRVTREIIGTRPFNTIEFSADGSQILAGMQSGHLSIFDIESGNLIVQRESKAHFDTAISAVTRCTADGKQFATSCGSLVMLWDTTMADRKRTLTLPFGSRCTELFSSSKSSKLGAIFENGTIQVWDLLDFKELPRFDLLNGLPQCAALSSDGEYLAAGSSSGAIFVWNLNTQKLIAVRPSGAKVVSAIAFADDGQRLATGHDDGSCKIWDVELKGPPVRLLGGAGPIRSVQFTPDAANLVSLDSTMVANFPKIHVWSLSTCSARESAILSSDMSSAGFLDNGAFFTALPTGRVTIWDSLLKRKKEHFNIRNSRGCPLFVAQDGHTVALLRSDSVSLFNLIERAQPTVIKCSEKPVEVLFTSIENLVLVRHQDKSIAAWDFSSEKPSMRWKRDSIKAVAASRIGTLILVPSEASGFEELDLATGESLSKTSTNQQLGFEISISNDASLITAVEGTSLLTAWARDPADSTKWVRISEALCSFMPTSLAITPDNRRVFVGGFDFIDFSGGRGVVAYWNVSKTNLLSTFRRYPSVVRDVQFRSDGRLMSVIHGAVDERAVQTIEIYDDGQLYQERHADAAIEAVDLVIDKGDVLALCVGGPSSWGRAVSRSFELLDTVTGQTDQGGRIRAPSGREICSPETTFNSIDITPDGDRYVTADATGRKLVLWDSLKNEATYAIGDLPSGPLKARFSPDGTRVAAVLSNHTVSIWNSGSKKLEVTIPINSEKISDQFIWSSNGTSIAVAVESEVMFYDSTSGKVSEQRLAHSHPVSTIAAGRDGRTLFSGCSDGVIRAWDCETGVLKSEFRSHRFSIKDIAVHPSQAAIASLDAEGEVLVWDVKKAAVSHTVVRPNEARRANTLSRLIWARDGKRLIGAGSLAYTQWQFFEFQSKVKEQQSK